MTPLLAYNIAVVAIVVLWGGGVYLVTVWEPLSYGSAAPAGASLAGCRPSQRLAGCRPELHVADALHGVALLLRDAAHASLDGDAVMETEAVALARAWLRAAIQLDAAREQRDPAAQAAMHAHLRQRIIEIQELAA